MGKEEDAQEAAGFKAKEKGANRSLNLKKQMDNNYDGSDYVADDDLKDGPLDGKKRKCTDCIMFVIFNLFTFVMFFIMIWSFVKGQVGELMSSMDDDGNMCGYTAGYEDYPRVYFP
jgi:hypothetical protein